MDAWTTTKLSKVRSTGKAHEVAKGYQSDYSSSTDESSSDDQDKKPTLRTRHTSKKPKKSHRKSHRKTKKEDRSSSEDDKVDRGTYDETDSDSGNDSDTEVGERAKKEKIVTSTGKKMDPYRPVNPEFKDALDYRSYRLQERSHKYRTIDGNRMGKHTMHIREQMIEKKFDV